MAFKMKGHPLPGIKQRKSTAFPKDGLWSNIKSKASKVGSAIKEQFTPMVPVKGSQIQKFKYPTSSSSPKKSTAFTQGKIFQKVVSKLGDAAAKLTNK